MRPDNGLSPGRHQAITWTNAGMLLIVPLGTNFSEILVEIYVFFIKKTYLNCRQEIGDDFVLASMCKMNFSNTRINKLTKSRDKTIPDTQQRKSMITWYIKSCTHI